MFDIFLDEKIMDSKNGTKLLNFAKEKNWIVTIEKKRIVIGYLYNKVY